MSALLQGFGEETNEGPDNASIRSAYDIAYRRVPRLCNLRPLGARGKNMAPPRRQKSVPMVSYKYVILGTSTLYCTSHTLVVQSPHLSSIHRLSSPRTQTRASYHRSNHQISHQKTSCRKSTASSGAIRCSCYS